MKKSQPKGPKRGWYKIQNLDKYQGPTNNGQIEYKSGLEQRFMVYCDTSDRVMKWSYEPFTIPYFCPTDNQWHNYFPDFLVKKKLAENKTQTYLIEVKCTKEVFAPKRPKKQTLKYLTETATYIKNQAKWQAAEKLCKKKGWIFHKSTEESLHYKRGKKKS